MTSSREKQRQEFREFYLKLEKESKGDPVLRVFQREGYYTVHGQTAFLVADRYFGSREAISSNSLEGKDALPTLSMRAGKLAQILRDVLLERREKVELWRKRGGEWEVFKRGTPGDLRDFEDILAEGGGLIESAAVMALQLSFQGNVRRIGVAMADTVTRTLSVCEIEDSERFVNLESLAVQYSARECLLSFQSSVLPGDRKKVEELLDGCQIPYREAKQADFKAADIAADLSRLLSSPIEQHSDQLDKKLAMGSLACLIKNLDLKNAVAEGSGFVLKPIDLHKFVKLDQSAVTALHLFPQATDSDKNMSLHGLLNKNKTAMGTRLLAQWIKQPLRDVSEIRRRQDVIEALMDDRSLRDALRDQHLQRMPDLDRVIKKLARKKVNLQGLVHLYHVIVRLGPLRDELDRYDGKHRHLLQAAFVAPLANAIAELEPLEKMINDTVDLDAIDRHEYVVNPNFSEKLRDLSDAKKQLLKEMEAVAESARNKLGMDEKTLKLMESAQQGWHLKVSRKSERALRAHAKTFITLETRNDGVKFTTMKLQKLSKEYQEAASMYDEEQKAIVEQVVEVAAEYVPTLERVAALVAELDVFVGIAYVAANSLNGYCRPEILPQGSGVIELKACRHPCLEALDGRPFVANDVSMRKGESNVQIITGPNMGGKSTYIRQVGVVVLMALMGCPVPCEAARVTVVDCIMARVGAGDIQLKGVSTFMKEMLEASAILKNSTRDSLVIIDELGRGTSTYDGFGLAWAISEHIAREIGCFALFATHFHELTALAAVVPSVVNKHVTACAGAETITMLYQVRDGPCDQSFGIHVAEIARFPPQVIESARVKVAELEEYGRQAQLTDAVKHFAQLAAASELAPAGSKRKQPDDASGLDSQAAKRQRQEVNVAPLDVRKFLADFASTNLSALPAGSNAYQEAVATLRGKAAAYGLVADAV